MTRTTPLRRMIRQLSQRLVTEADTFIVLDLLSPCASIALLTWRRRRVSLDRAQEGGSVHSQWRIGGDDDPSRTRG
jgi:hypothetical protein